MFYRRAVVPGLILLLLAFVSGCGKSSGSGTPSIVSLSVSTVTVGSPATTETVTGTNFTKSSVVNFNGTALTTTYTSPTQVSATIPASSLTKAGTFGVTVTDSGRTSNSVNFTVSSAAPTISSLNPGSANAGGAGFVLTVTGSGFNQTSTISWNGNTIPTTYLDSTQLNADISAALIASSGSIPVTVTTTSSGTSTAQNFLVNAPVPIVTGINPTTIYAGSGDTTLTVNGSNFLPNSTVQLAGSTRTTVFISRTQLSVSLAAADLASAATPAITVVNPGPQGGTSNPLQLSIVTRPANQPPVANAGPAQTVATGSTVNLDGYGSSDGDGSPLTFQWTIASRPAGSAAALNNASSPTPSFTADVAGNYSVQLVVSNGSQSSSPSTVIISTTNSAPVADAGFDQTAKIGVTVQLDGTGSTDVDGNRLTYAWSLTGVPSGSAATLSSASSPQPTFVVDKAGSYTAQLVVNDGSVSSAPSTVTISTSNSAPVARAGRSQAANVGATVHLDGSASGDFDGDPLTYSWAITNAPAGSSAALSSSTLLRPTFVADKAGTYLVQLIVNDGTVNSVASTLTVSTVNTPPVANAGIDRTVTAGKTVVLDGSGSTDADGNSLSYRWALIARPAGSAAALSSAIATQPTFTADVAGAYVAQLIVNDGSIDSAPSTVTISTANSAPVANAGSAQVIAAGATVQLDGTGSTDVDGNSLHFAWALLSKPAGSAAFLSDPTIPNPAFVADKAGDYVAQLMVNDGHFYSSASTVTISTSAVAPIANAGHALNASGGAVQLDGSSSFDPGGAGLSYAWALISKPAGSGAALSSSTAQKPSFTPDIAGDYVAELAVANGTITSAPVTVLVSTVYAPPFADAGTNQGVNVGSAANLDGSGSGSPQGSALTYKWSLIALPTGSTAALNDATAQAPSFTLDSRGAYVGQLIVNDGVTDSAPRTVAVTSSNRPPVANAGAAQTVSVGSTVTLNGSGSSDPDGLPLSYQWRFTAIPNGSTATLAASTTSAPTFVADLQGTYTVELVVSDGLLTSAAATVNITVGPNTNITFTPSPLDMNGNSTANLVLTLGQTAGSGGVTVNLSSSDTSVATVPASVNVPSGSSTANVLVTSLSKAGSTTINGSATGYTAGTVTVTVTTNTMTVPNITVGKDLQGSAAVAFSVATGASTTVTVTTSDTSKILLSNSATSKGGDTATVTAGAGTKNSPSFFVQALTDTGTATLTIKAPGYQDTTATVTLAPAGFIIQSGVSATLNSDTLNTSAFSVDSTLTIWPAALDPTTKAVLSTQTVRGGMGSQTVKLTNSSNTVGTISTGSVSLGAGVPNVSLTFHPLTTGTTDISVTEPTGFTTPANFQVLHVNVGNATIAMNPLTVGVNLQAADTIYLSDPAPTPGGVDVTITSSDASKVVLSSDPTQAGAASATVHVNGGTRGLPNFYVQALASSGTVTLTAKGTGLTDSTTTITLAPSGFVIVNSSINSGSTGDSTVTVGTSVLDASLNPTGARQAVRPGAAPANVGITSSNTGVATVTSPVAFAANASTATSTFHPVAAGNTTISIQTPAGFSTPTQYQSIAASVGLPGMTTQTAVTIGKDLQTSDAVTLNTAPGSPVAVTVTSNSTAVAVLSTDPTAVGSGTLTFNNISTSTPSFYIQGMSIGSTTLTVSAAGYATTTIYVTVNPSGFTWVTPNFSVDPNKDKTVSIAPAVLDATSLNYLKLLPLRGGASATVGLTSSNTAIGTITTPVTFTGNQAAGTATFHSIVDGQTLLATVAPAGFSTPATFGTITASVGLPGMTTNTNVNVGNGLQQSNNITLNTAPTSPVNVTITSNSASIATVSTDATVAGTASVTFNSISSTTPNFYIQGMSEGTTTLTVTATGYATTTINVVVGKSGFVITTANFTATSGSDTPVGIAAEFLDSSLNYTGVIQPVRPGLTVSVSMTSDNTAAGTITTPVAFSGGQSTSSATFHAVAIGTAHVTVGTPTGFSTPTSRTSVTATVQ